MLRFLELNTRLGDGRSAELGSRPAPGRRCETEVFWSPDSAREFARFGRRYRVDAVQRRPLAICD